MKRIVFIVNPAAGNGRAQSKWQTIRPQLTLQHEVYVTEFPRHGVALAREICAVKKETLLIVIGGDGTVHEVIEGCAGAAHVSITLLSAGSGNDFARTFTAVQSAKEIEQLASDSTKKQLMRMGNIATKIQQAIFVNNTGFGFDAKVVFETNRSLWKRRLNRFGLGKLAYYGVVVKEMLSYRPSAMELVVEHQTYRFQNVWFVVVCNQPYFGGGMKISPKSNPEDDTLEVTVVANISRWKLLLLFGTVFIGWHTKIKAVHSFSGTLFQFSFAETTIGHADGEYCGELKPGERAEVKLLPQTWAMPVK
ncbi:diacylglycerol kinase family protein [Chryseomicrobium sp. FSL W7-1435]|uniref:diacylglycerol/lipid kinase family protein n=1 Tax=Chryseomicrobium sp. FSL W7-1435 TaxID=2921704 RepID=UPI00315A16A1